MLGCLEPGESQGTKAGKPRQLQSQARRGPWETADPGSLRQTVESGWLEGLGPVLPGRSGVQRWSQVRVQEQNTTSSGRKFEREGRKHTHFLSASPVLPADWVVPTCPFYEGGSSLPGPSLSHSVSQIGL